MAIRLKPIERMFWNEYLARSPSARRERRLFVEASFAGNRAVTDELIVLYLAGRKTAGSGLVADFRAAGDPLPKPGNYWIALDSSRRPRCLLKTVRVEINVFKEIPRRVVRAEGEGDLSTAHWQKVHRAAYRPSLKAWGVRDLDEAEVVTEHFRLVHASLPGAAGIILEGVAGSGKTSVLKILRRHPAFRLRRGLVVDESETFGEAMEEAASPGATARFARRMRRVVARLRKMAHAGSPYILERFHPSYYALRPEWPLYAELDAELESLGVLVVLLTIPEADMRARFWRRPERGEKWRRGLRAYFGSERSAIQAAVDSQRRRAECRPRSRLPWIVIDTSARDWPSYAARIVREWEMRTIKRH